MVREFTPTLIIGMRMKRNFFLSLFFLFSLSFFIPNLFAEADSDLKRLGEDIVNIEFNTNGVDIYFALYNENFIAYRVLDKEETNSTEKKDSKVKVFVSKKKLQFYTIAPAKAEVYIYLPKDFLLESCRIQAIYSKIKIEKIKSIYFVLSCTYADIEVANSKFKNLLVASSHSKLSFSSGIVAVADFCLDSVNGKIEIAEEQNFCNIFITQIKNENLILNGKPYEHPSLCYAPQNPKKHLTLSASFSDLAINFIPPLKEPVEKFDQYGISEFGPKPPPNLIDPVSNFLPKKP